ncbi:hypothetical protein GCM10010145_61330 [Streptomyces ruber]|uniref:Secreted protein n=2 Tax=Streptomyces TaxID=1883 RepID=A0A918EZ62_9ACTN|nr:hypothetical protein [Streptomyces ruber]GGQ83520.1 hypothetical protein GCM10010145_61330 [Streptomyces ruber]
MHTLRRVLAAGASSTLLVLGAAVHASPAQAQPADLLPGGLDTALMTVVSTQQQNACGGARSALEVVPVLADTLCPGSTA